nr:CRISPR-associated helicase Cas3' [uncultured Streptomyces sp.]
MGAFAVPRGGLPAGSAVVVSGLVVVADWLASRTSAIQPRIPAPGWSGTAAEVDAHWKGAVLAAPEWVRAARLGRAQFSVTAFGAMFPFTPNSLQGDLVAHLPGMVGQRGTGLVLVTAPTGDGKTEAALFAASLLGRASGARGVYFALPTMGTADAMLPRVKEYASRALSGERALMLLHSMAWLTAPDAEPEKGAADLPGSGVEVPTATAAATAAAAAADADAAGDARLADPEAAVAVAVAVADRREAAEAGSAAEDRTGGREELFSAGKSTVIEADGWLRGAKRGLLAPLGVGTIDQVLGSVLPLRYNVLRLFGLSDKVFVVDEAHAYGPWMHQLLLRLLEWLGEMRAPVVLLSATLTGRSAGSLVDAYRRGAGFREPSGAVPRYPGWLYVSGVSGQVSAARGTVSDRARKLTVTRRPVVWDTAEAAGSPVREGGRRAALREALAPVAAEGGTALVCCTTVAEAQQTYRDVCAAFPALAERPGGVELLHSRYPADERAAITARCEAAYGKPGEGPVSVRPASVLVATQVVEQSLDLDFDLVVSDLAPLAQLLQRAGRARRHSRGPHGRPVWAVPEDSPELVVLDPLDASGGRPPRTWGSVYDAGLLVRTSRLLDKCAGDGIAVPGDVQRLVDEVYEDDFVDGLADAAARDALARMDEERAAGEAAERSLANWTSICAPADVGGDLGKLSARDAGVTEELLTTRLGADTGRVLCLYEQENGRATLDRAGRISVPTGSRPEGCLRAAELAAVARRVAPVPGQWLRGDEFADTVPAGWGTHPTLRDLVVLRMRPAGAGVWVSRQGRRALSISDLGLETE